MAETNVIAGGNVAGEMPGPSGLLSPTFPSGDVYLITLSKANMGNFPSATAFAQAVIHVVRELNLTLYRWVASKQQNEGGAFHYHMAIHLSERRKWNQIRNMLAAKYEIQCHFKHETCGYERAHRYVTKCAAPNWN